MGEKDKKAAEKEMEQLVCQTSGILKGIPVKALRVTHVAILASMVSDSMKGHETLSIKHLENLYRIMGIDITWPDRNGKS